MSERTSSVDQNKEPEEKLRVEIKVTDPDLVDVVHVHPKMGRVEKTEAEIAVEFLERVNYCPVHLCEKVRDPNIPDDFHLYHLRFHCLECKAEQEAEHQRYLKERQIKIEAAIELLKKERQIGN